MYDLAMPDVTELNKQQYIAVFGCWNGDIDWANKSISSASLAGMHFGIHLGNIGSIGETAQYLESINMILRENGGMTLYVVPGSVDDYDYIEDDNNFDVQEDGRRKVKITDGESFIYFLPRGFTWNQSGKDIMAVGGAGSLDKSQRIQDGVWHKQESISPSEAESAIAGLPETVDAMFTHDTPRNIFALSEELAQSHHLYGHEAVAYTEQSRGELDRIFRHARPATLFCANWKIRFDEAGEFIDDEMDAFESRVIGLGDSGTFENLAIYDVINDEPYFVNNDNFVLFGRNDLEQVDFER